MAKEIPKLLLCILYFFHFALVGGQVTDIDGNTYKTVKIGTKIWMAENLKVTRYNNGEMIRQIEDKENWSRVNFGAWAFYDNKKELGNIYGKLYNGYAIMDERGLCPDGWHIPSYNESQLLLSEGGSSAGLKSNGNKYWMSPNKFANNKSGFTALPSGQRNEDGSFEEINNEFTWWSQFDEGYISTSCISLLANSKLVSLTHGVDIEAGLAVRCIKD